MSTGILQSYILCQPHLVLLLCLTYCKPEYRARIDGGMVVADTESGLGLTLNCFTVCADFSYLQCQLDTILNQIVLQCWMRKHITVD